MAGVYIDSQGPFEHTPESEADVAALKARLDSGEARPASEAEAKSFYDARLQRQALSGLSGTAQAVGLGGLRGVTAGLSDPVLSLIPGYAEKARALEEAHPTASVGAEIVGNILPLVATGGASAAEQAGGAGLKEAIRGAVKVAGTPVRVIDKIGRAVEAATAAEGAGLVGKLASQAARGAVEGGLYAAGHQLSESVLDPNWTSQAMLADVGLGALMGGGFGAALGLVTHGATKAAEALQASRAKWQEAADAIEGKGVEYLAKANKMAVKDVDTLYQGAKQFEDLLDSPERRAALAQARYSSFRSLEGVAKDTMKGLSEAKPEEMASLLASRDLAPAQEAAKKILGTVDAAIAKASIDHLPTAVNELQAFREHLENKLTPALRGFVEDVEATGAMKGATGAEISSRAATAYDAFSALDESKRWLDDRTNKIWKHDPTLRNQNDLAFKKVRAALKTTLEDEGVWGEAGAAQAKVNGALSEYIQARDLAQKHYATKALRVANRFEDSGWDPVRFDVAAGQKSGFKGEMKQAAATRYVEAVKGLLDVAEDAQKRFPHLQITDKEARDIYTKAAHWEARSAGFEKYASTAKPTRMSFQSSAMPGQQGVSLAEGAYSAAKAAALGHLVSGGAAIGIPGLGFMAGAVEAAVQARKLIHDVPAATRLLAKLGSTGDRVLERIARVADKVVSLEPKAARVVGIAAKESTRKETFEKRSKQVQAWMENLPEAIANAQHETIAQHAPNISASVAGQSAVAIQFLAQTLPKPQQFSPLVPARQPGISEQSRWMALYDAVDRPLDILGGNPSREQVQAIAFTHPALMDAIRSKVLTSLASKKDPTKTSHEARQRAALILGQDVDGSMQSMAVNQMLYAGVTTMNEQQAQQQANQQGRTNAAVARMGLAKRKEEDETKEV